MTIVKYRPALWASPDYISKSIENLPLPPEGGSLDVLFTCGTSTDGIACGDCDGCRGHFEWGLRQHAILNELVELERLTGGDIEGTAAWLRQIRGHIVELGLVARTTTRKRAPKTTETTETP